MWKRSYVNMIMLFANIPKYKDKKEDAKKVDDMSGFEDFIKAKTT